VRTSVHKPENSPNDRRSGSPETSRNENHVTPCPTVDDAFARPSNAVTPRLTLRSITADEVGHSMRLLADAFQARGLQPGCTIAVMNGGLLPARAFQAHFTRPGPLMKIHLRRKTTGPVKATLAQLTHRLPLRLSDWIMLQEMRLRRVAHTCCGADRTISPHPHAVARLRDQPAVRSAQPDRPVVIVDDAIDTGITAARLHRSLLEVGVEPESIRIVCLTHTFPHPAIRADFFACQGVVLRFPWSARAAGSIDTP